MLLAVVARTLFGAGLADVRGVEIFRHELLTVVTSRKTSGSPVGHAPR